MRILRETPDAIARRVWERVTYEGMLQGNLTYKVELASEHLVTMYADGRARKGYGCTCAHGSMYGVNKPDELCKGMKAVREAIKNRGRMTW